MELETEGRCFISPVPWLVLSRVPQANEKVGETRGRKVRERLMEAVVRQTACAEFAGVSK